MQFFNLDLNFFTSLRRLFLLLKIAEIVLLSVLFFEVTFKPKQNYSGLKYLWNLR